MGSWTIPGRSSSSQELSEARMTDGIFFLLSEAWSVWRDDHGYAPGYPYTGSLH